MSLNLKDFLSVKLLLKTKNFPNGSKTLFSPKLYQLLPSKINTPHALRYKYISTSNPFIHLLLYLLLLPHTL